MTDTNTTVKITDALTFYARLNKPNLKYQMEEVEGFPYKNKEYVADFLIPFAQMKELKKQWRKSVKAFQTISGVSPKDFKTKYKTEELPGNEYKNEDGEYELIKFRKHASNKDGEPNPPPKLVGKKRFKVGDVEHFKSVNGYDITQETNVGNGSLCNVQLRGRKLNTASGKDYQLDLQYVQVIDLVPYEGQSKDEFDYDDEEGDDFEAPTKSNKSNEPDYDDESEDDDDDFE